MMSRRGMAGGVLMHWQMAGPNTRLMLGTSLVVVIMLFGLTPRTVFGMDLAWPYAALVAAVGWARVGLSIRPMLVLCALGFLQDLVSMAPLGCFVMVNLITYGLYTVMAGALDTAHDPVLARLLPFVSLLAGVMSVWLIASTLADHAVSLLPLIGVWITTALLYVALQPVFDLNRRPGEYGGLG